ncbi:MAG: hypothetical protein DRO14_06390, partial [Thermoprotei archaeon]
MTAPSGDKYIIKSVTYGWSIEIPPENGGKAMNITLPNGEKIGADWLHFGPTRNPDFSYLGYKGTGNTDNMRYLNRYIYGQGDPLLELYQGVVFIIYAVEEVPLYDNNIQKDVAMVNFEYRIFDWGLLVTEKIKWKEADSDTDYLVGGWVFDQDNGLETSTFNFIANDTAYLYPIEMSTISGGVETPNNKPFRDVSGLPLLAVYRVYWSAGTHTVTLTNLDYSQEDTYVYIYDESGSFIDSAYAYRESQASFSFSVPTDGYYYVVVGSYDDENSNGYTQFDIYIDGILIDTGVRVKGFYVGGGGRYTVDAYSISLHTINVSQKTVNEPYKIELLWTESTTNLDMYLYGPPGSNPVQGNVIDYSEATGGTYESIAHVFSSPGAYVLLIYKASGSTTTTSYNIKYYSTTPEFDDYYNLNSLDHVAFFNNITDIGIGYVFLEEITSGVTYTSSSLMWYNEGNDSDADYIYVAKRYQGLSATSNNELEVRYAVFYWNATGVTFSEMYNGFNTTKVSLKNPLSISKSPIEKFKIKVNVKVVDNDNLPIEEVTIDFINSTNQVEYSATTNASGYAVLDVARKSYTIKATLTSGGLTYTTSVSRDYGTYSYDTLSDNVLITFTGIIRFRLQALTNETKTGSRQYIQSARIVLNDSTHVIDTQTNLTGWIDLYLPAGTWTIAFNATSTATQDTPDPWDIISIYNDSALLVDNRTAGPSINVTITLTKGWIYYLVDQDITQAPPATKLSLFNTLTFYDVYWGKTVKIQVNFTRTDTGEGIDGEVRWYVINSSGGAELSGIATKQTIGGFSFEVNISNLDAGEYYTILVNGTPADPSFLLPSPITVGLSVKERPTALDVSFNPP